MKAITASIVFQSDGTPSPSTPLLDVEIRHQPHPGEPSIAVQIGNRVIRISGPPALQIMADYELYRSQGTQSAFWRGFLRALPISVPITKGKPDGE